MVSPLLPLIASEFNRDVGQVGSLMIPAYALAAATAAGALDWPEARFDMVRVGIGIYGVAPAEALEGRVPQRPVDGGGEGDVVLDREPLESG